MGALQDILASWRRSQGVRHLLQHAGALLHTLVAAIFVIGLILSALYWWNLEQRHAELRAEAIHQANKRASQLAELQAQHIRALILGIDQALRQYRDAIAADHRDQATAVAQTALDSFPAQSLVHFAATDRQGYYIHSTAELTAGLNLADREYFRWHMRNARDEIFINRPIIGRLVNHWVILISRPILRQRKFEGVAFVSLSPFYLSQMMGKLKMDAADVASLIHVDGDFMARSVYVDKILGSKVPLERPYLGPAAPIQGNFQAQAMIDGLPRLYAWHRVEGLPLVVSVGLDEQALLAPVEEQIASSRWRSMISLLILWLALGMIFWLLLRVAKQQKFLQRNEALLRSTLESTEAGVLVVGEDGRVAASNRRLSELWCLPAELEKSGIASKILQHMAEQLVDAQNFIARSALGAVGAQPGSDEFLCQDGRVFERYSQAFWFGTRRMRFFAFRDITQRIRAEREQARLNRALRLLSDCNMTLVRAQNQHHLLSEICRLVVERGGYLLAWVGYAEDDKNKSVHVVNKFGTDNDFLAEARVSWDDTERGHGPTGTAIRTGKISIMQDFQRNPQTLPWRERAIAHGFQACIALPLRANNKVFGALVIYSAEADAFKADEVALLQELTEDLAYGIDVLRARAEHEAIKEELSFVAHFDVLTRLPNLLLLHDRFEYALRMAGDSRPQLAFLYLDLDNFRAINDGMGTTIGDRLLQRLVELLQSVVPGSATLSRRGGDEFILLLNETRDAESVVTQITKIQECIAEPIQMDNYSIATSLSIGISLYPHDGTDFNDLVQKANTAMGYAKGSGGNTYRYFTETMNNTARQETRIIGLLHQALKNREFFLHYQPQVDIATRRITGLEALIRWQCPELGTLSPAMFIPLAEQSGHIVQIGEWVIQEACLQARRWHDAGINDIIIAVNLSAIQFKRSDVAATVKQALEASGLPAACLELELTESVLLQNLGETMETLRRLKEIGVKLSIDDFGTGYSSMAYLKQLAVDKLKIDQSFIRNLHAHTDDASIVRAIVQLGLALQLRLIAEGVETDEQLRFLEDIGCHEAQGYLFSRPLPAEEISELLPRADSVFLGNKPRK